jgi:hypothetical protein
LLRKNAAAAAEAMAGQEEHIDKNSHCFVSLCSLCSFVANPSFGCGWLRRVLCGRFVFRGGGGASLRIINKDEGKFRLFTRFANGAGGMMASYDTNCFCARSPEPAKFS